MRDHSDDSLHAVITCLRDAVTPAVDPGDPQAVEQLRLCIDYLSFLHDRVYDIHARHRFELGHQLSTARALREDAVLVSQEAADRLEAAVDQAGAVLATPESTTRALRASSEQLWATVRGVVRCSAAAPDDVRRRISATIRAGVAPLVELERSWYLPLGFEMEPETVPPLDQLLAP